MKKLIKKFFVFGVLTAFVLIAISKIEGFVLEDAEDHEINSNKKNHLNEETNLSKLSQSDSEKVNKNSAKENKEKSVNPVKKEPEKPEVNEPELKEPEKPEVKEPEVKEPEEKVEENENNSISTVSINDTAPEEKQCKNRIRRTHCPCYKTKEVVKRMNNPKYKGKKLAFLTFDDGVNTTISNQIIDILEEEGVNATFFVVGKNLEDAENQRILKKAFNGGNAIATHSYYHNYNLLYPNRKANSSRIVDEHRQAVLKMKEILGEDFDSKVFRYPGGHMSWDKGSLKDSDQALAFIGVYWVDWNASNGDAQPLKINSNDISRPRNSQEVINNFEKSLTFTANPRQVVILMHDAPDKAITANSLSKLIRHLKNKGYSFGVLG